MSDSYDKTALHHFSTFISDNINNSIKNKGLKNEEATHSNNQLTDGQIYFFKKRKIDYSKLTKFEASKMIDEIKKSENK